MYDSWNNNLKILLVLGLPKCGLPFCAVNITGILRISFRFYCYKKPKIVEILKAHTGRPHFGNFGILFLKLGWRIDATNYFYDQRRPSFRLATVIFRGTPCISLPGEPWTLYVSPLPGELWILYISSYLDKPEPCMYTPTWRTLNLAFIFLPGEPQPCMQLYTWRNLSLVCLYLPGDP